MEVDEPSEAILASALPRADRQPHGRRFRGACLSPRAAGLGRPDIGRPATWRHDRPKSELAQLLNAKNPEEADKLIDQATAAEPGSPEILQVRGEMLRSRGDLDGALRLLGQALQIDPNGPIAEPAFDRLVAEIRACTICAPHLPFGPRPIVRGRPSARLLIISQAPGKRVHETGLSFNDRSGDRLRTWLALDRETFYDEARVAILGMAFCYPGRDAKGGDHPPRPECAPRWHTRLRALFPAIELTLLVGSYAIGYYLPGFRTRSMTEAIARWRDFLPEFFVLPHPSWRTTWWLRDNPWFENEALPELRVRVARAVSPTPRSAPCPRR